MSEFTTEIPTEFIKTPTDDLLSIWLIKRVSHVPGKGVVVFDGYGRMLAYIKLKDDMLAKRVRDLFNEIVLDRRNAKQPDWSFLTQPPQPPVAKSTKG